LSNKIINLVQEGYLVVGTKQRVASLFIEKIIKKRPTIHTLLYAGTPNGFGMMAVSYAAYKNNLQSIIFIGGEITNYKTRQITTLQALNSKIFHCQSFIEARKMEYEYSTPSKDGKEWIDLPGYYTVPMGLHHPIMIHILSQQIKKASKRTMLWKMYQNKNKIVRIWMVSGSGAIAMALHKAFPEAKIFLYLTGGGSHKEKVLTWIQKTKNVIEIKKENLINDCNKYYHSVKDYDDLVWPYVKKYGQSNDFIWNIAADDYLF
jgi:hypothetical protein